MCVSRVYPRFLFNWYDNRDEFNDASFDFVCLKQFYWSFFLRRKEEMGNLPGQHSFLEHVKYILGSSVEETNKYVILNIHIAFTKELNFLVVSTAESWCLWAHRMTLTPECRQFDAQNANFLEFEWFLWWICPQRQLFEKTEWATILWLTPQRVEPLKHTP